MVQFCSLISPDAYRKTKVESQYTKRRTIMIAGTMGNRVIVGILPTALVATLMTPTATLTRRSIIMEKRKKMMVKAKTT